MRWFIWGLSLSCFLVAGVNLQAVAADPLRFAPTGGQLTSEFGWRTDPITKKQRFHAGMDIAAPAGSLIYAPEPGQVVFADTYAGYGNVVVLRHSPTTFTLYAHNTDLLVKVNDWVVLGTPIATVGATGRATGPHLHFEVHNNKQYINPRVYLMNLQQQLIAQGILPGTPGQSAQADPRLQRLDEPQVLEVGTSVGGPETEGVELIEGHQRSWISVD